MSIKTIFIIVITILVTVILMKNTDEVNFWIFGPTYVPKLAVLGVMFALGLIAGYMLGRPRRKVSDYHEPEVQKNFDVSDRDQLSDEDREYIS